MHVCAIQHHEKAVWYGLCCRFVYLVRVRAIVHVDHIDEMNFSPFAFLRFLIFVTRMRGDGGEHTNS